MKTIAAVVLLILAMPAVADEWTEDDTIVQLTLTSVMMVDWMQTMNGVQSGKASEMNPLLGPHPSRQRINLMIGGAILGHAAVAYILPQPMRRIWQVTVLVAEVGAVAGNATLGIGLSLPW